MTSLRSRVLLAVPLLVAGLAPGFTAAQEAPPGAQPKVELRLSYQSDDKAPRTDLVLRPNLQQELFVFVKNDDPQPQPVTVQLLANDAPVLAQKLTAEAGKLTRVVWSKAVPAAGMAKGPALTELKGALKLRLLDGKDKPVGKEVDLDVARPSTYVMVDSIQFFPNREGVKNQLIVGVKTREGFAGPVCRVELVLRPDRIPGFVAGQKQKGLYGGNLTGTAGEVLYLHADDLQFKGGEDKNGLVYLTVDGYDRAFTFEVSFPASGTPTTPNPVTKVGLRLNAEPFASSKVPYPVGIEVDNASRDARVKLEVLSPVLNKEGKFEEKFSELAEFRGDRAQRLLYAAGGTEGGLVFQPEVKDWATELDLSAIHGQTMLRLRMFDKDGKPVYFRDNETGKTVSMDAPWTKKSVTLVDEGPEGIRFVEVPQTAVRGGTVVVKATRSESESKVGDKEVVFFGAKLPPDGKVPPNVAPVTARMIEGKNVWSAELPVAKDQKSPLEVSVRFTNAAGLSKTESLAIEVTDPPPPPTTGTITGIVVQGDRRQPGIPVRLLDDKGQVKDTTMTNNEGKFEFKDVPPGSYRVTAAKTGDNTRGEAAAQVVAGKEKKVEIKLLRR
jgi:hypothetical protein